VGYRVLDRVLSRRKCNRKGLSILALGINLFHQTRGDMATADANGIRNLQDGPTIAIVLLGAVHICPRRRRTFDDSVYVNSALRPSVAFL